MAKSEPSNDAISFQKETSRIAATLPIGGLGGALFATFQLPLPWLLGAMATTNVASLAGLRMALRNRLRAPMTPCSGSCWARPSRPSASNPRCRGCRRWVRC